MLSALCRLRSVVVRQCISQDLVEPDYNSLPLLRICRSLDCLTKAGLQQVFGNTFASHSLCQERTELSVVLNEDFNQIWIERLESFVRHSRLGKKNSAEPVGRRC